MKLFAITTQLGVKGDPIGNRSVHLDLGRKIYGEEHECLHEINLEELKSMIIALIPTSEEWAAMQVKEKVAFAIGDMKLFTISTQFGIKGSPVGNHSIHLELGRKIYGEEHECLQFIEKTELETGELKSEIIALIPTPEEWAAMKVKEKTAFRIGDMKLTAIARKFDVKGFPVGNHTVHLKLGRKIYGEDHECLQDS